MLPLRKGRYCVRYSESAADVAAALALRQVAFGGDGGRDRFDEVCKHVLVEDLQTSAVVCCFRVLTLQGVDIARSYSAQFYDLGALEKFRGPMVELGRFCIRPDCVAPDILRIAWGGLTRIIDAAGGRLLFGCSSFRGTNAEVYFDAFALLRDRHLAPDCWFPRVKDANVVRFSDHIAHRKADLRLGVTALPPLLRTYLAMGGWVSDHAVVDRTMNTIHVFTGLEIAAIPPARARQLRAIAT